jgi:Flp pilus assembly protein TadD
MFRRGQIEAALRHLIKAYGLAPETDIAAHLGEVLWVSGRKEEARTIWRAALRDNADNQILIETLKRLGATL